jgi:hypothetical protein
MRQSFECVEKVGRRICRMKVSFFVQEVNLMVKLCFPIENYFLVEIALNSFFQACENFTFCCLFANNPDLDLNGKWKKLVVEISFEVSKTF